MWQAQCNEPNSPYHLKTVAIKIIDLEHFSLGSGLEDIRNEIHIMSQNHHPNVLQNYVSFVHQNELWLVMPLVKAGSLENILTHANSGKGLTDEVLIASILKQVVSGLQYFHSHGHIHRDIKAQNILLHENGQVCLSDFSVSDKHKQG